MKQLKVDSRMGSGHQKDQAMTKSLGLSALSYPPPERGEGLEVELIIHYAYMTKPKLWDPKSFQVGKQEECTHVLAGWCTSNSKRTEASRPFWTLLYVTLIWLFIHIFEYPV